MNSFFARGWGIRPTKNCPGVFPGGGWSGLELTDTLWPFKTAYVKLFRTYTLCRGGGEPLNVRSFVSIKIILQRLKKLTLVKIPCLVTVATVQRHCAIFEKLSKRI